MGSPVNSVIGTRQVQEYSLPNETFHPDILRMVGQEYLQSIRNLDEGTFDRALWLMLNQNGPAAYHRLTQEELKPGWLWAQKEADQQVAIYWTSQSGWIHRASRCGERVMVESFIAQALNIQHTLEEITIEQFQEVIGEYLTQNSSKAVIEGENLSLTSFQKHLEIVPIVCRITRAACEKLAELRKKYSHSVLEMSLHIGADGSESESFNPLTAEGVKLIEISEYFLNGRLPFLNDKEGKPEETSEPVAPVIRSWEALDQIKKLRKMTFTSESFSSVNVRQLDPERTVPNLSSLNKKTYETLKNKSLKDLNAWLVLVPGGVIPEPYQFEKLESGKTSSEEKLEFSIDFNETWKLRSKFFEKV